MGVEWVKNTNCLKRLHEKKTQVGQGTTLAVPTHPQTTGGYPTHARLCLVANHAT